MLTEATTLPLSVLVHDEAANAGHESRLSKIDDLLASIPAHGVIQSLLVRPIKMPGKGSKMHAVTAGNRRLAALKRLAADGKISADYPVPVIIAKGDDKAAHELSAVENIQRLPMTPVEEFRAYAQMRSDGRTDEDIALRFGVPVRRVQQRVRLADLHPEVLEALDAGKITLDAAQAFTIQPNPELQRQHLASSLSQNLMWQLSANNVRQAMEKLQLSSKSKQAQMIGEAAYVAAGGEIVRDLFSEESFWTSDDVIRSLSETAWQAQIDAWKAEGWSFVAPAEEFGKDSYGYDNAARLSRHWPVPIALDPKVQAEIDELNGKIEVLEAEWDACENEEDWPEEKGEEQHRLEEQVRKLSATQKAFTDEHRATGGVVYWLDFSREPMIGAIDPKRVKEAAKAAAAASGEPIPVRQAPDLEVPGDIVRDHCNAWLTKALQDKVGMDPMLALRVHVASLHCRMRTYSRPPLHLDGKSMQGSGDLPQGKEFAAALAWAHEQSLNPLLNYLAQLTAMNISIRWDGPHQGGPTARQLVDFVDPDTLAVFDAGVYFDGLKKPQIAYAYELMTGLKLKEAKKGEMAATAAARAKELGWLPPQLRTPSYADKGVTPAPGEPEQQLQAAE